MSIVETLHDKARNHPVCQQLIPLESVFSYPVPLNKDGQIYLRFFVYQRGRRLKGQPHPIYYPYAHLSFTYPSGEIVEYVDLYFTDGKPLNPMAEQINETTAQREASLSFDEVIAQRSRLFSAIENIIPLVNKTNLASEEQDIIQEYHRLLDALIEPGLRPFYERLNPTLFQLIK